MRTIRLTRSEAVAMVGEAAVAKVEGRAHHPSNRIGYYRYCHTVEEGVSLPKRWSVGVNCRDQNGKLVVLLASCLTLGSDDWEVTDFEVVG